MPTVLYGEAAGELTLEEQQVLKEGGVRLEYSSASDPLVDTVVQYAAIIDTSLSTKTAGQRLGVPESRVRQMIARRTLYSILHNNRYGDDPVGFVSLERSGAEAAEHRLAWNPDETGQFHIRDLKRRLQLAHEVSGAGSAADLLKARERQPLASAFGPTLPCCLHMERNSAPYGHPRQAASTPGSPSVWP